MLIERDVAKYSVFNEETIVEGLRRIAKARTAIVIGVDERGVACGLVTNGDILRWLVGQQSPDLLRPLREILNRSFAYARPSDTPDVIEALLARYSYVPILDDQGRLTGVARKRGEELQLGSTLLTKDSPAFLISEIGINHNGSLQLALELVDIAADAGANCAKFQMRDLPSLYSNEGNHLDRRENLGSQYTLDLLSRFQLTEEQFFRAFDHCRKRGLFPLCTPWDLVSLASLERYGMEAYKVASVDLTNPDILVAIARTGRPVLCSTGMSRESEISEAVRLLQREGASYALLHCNSTYPTPYTDVNLRYMDRLRGVGKCLVGYSGHERGYHIVMGAIALGAKIIEKHITIDTKMEGADHKVSLLPHELKEMVKAVRDLEQALGTIDLPRGMSQGEIINRTNLAKSLVINRDLSVGETITADMLDVKSPGRGLQPNRKADLVGRRAKRSFRSGDFFFPSDLLEGTAKARKYRFRRPWGLPVRYHDFVDLTSVALPDFLEFHLSYRDLDIPVEECLSHPLDLGLVVHSPDLFAGDHLLDLATDNVVHARRSLNELQRVVEVTRRLQRYFPKAPRPLIVASLGGVTERQLASKSERAGMYARLAENLRQLDQEGVEVVLQTLPPFPWYFGGQYFLNLFVAPAETADFCRVNGYRLCLDVSHSKLASNHFGWSFRDFVEETGQFVAHLHLADARGTSGEGLQIGGGEIDFSVLSEQLSRLAPQASFIPEIWQGHENRGEGFWVALERLEKWL